MKLTFCGAAGEVTGSQHLIECGPLRVLLDCGLFQGRRAESRIKNEQFRCDPRNLDAVLLSHAHIDHCGNLPGLYKAGFRGPVFCSAATADVAEVMLKDAAKIQAEDVRYLRKHLPHDAPPVPPLFDEEHVAGIVKLFEPLPLGKWHELGPELRVKFSEAGHILGSVLTEMEFQERGETRRLVFTGDLGRRGLPLLRDPQLIGGCDLLITESTYANRLHPPASDLKAELLRIIQRAAETGGRVIIPAFSLGRTQTIVYFLNDLHNAGLLPDVPVYVDSPLSRELTRIYRHHASSLDAESQRILRTDRDLFSFAGLNYIATPQESMQLNHAKGAQVIIAASGMCESGRVLHHLKHAVADARNTIVIIGFQAEHTLGRRIVERQKFLKILDRQFALKADVVVLNGLSAHADAEDFRWWCGHMASETGIGQAFLVHGEQSSRDALATLIRDFCDEDAVLPEQFQTFEV